MDEFETSSSPKEMLMEAGTKEAEESLGVSCRRQHRNSHSLYLILLAFFDFWMALAYIPLMSLNVLVDYLSSVVLLRAWCVLPVLFY